MSEVRRLYLLGPIVLETAEGELRVDAPAKTLALLGYLARSGQPLERRQLAARLWGETTDQRSRRNLTRALGHLGAQLPGCIHGDQQRVVWEPVPPFWTDVNAIEDLLAPRAGEAQASPERIEAAAAIYRGEFLEGVALDDCPELEIWLIREREHWRQRVSRAMAELVAQLAHSGQFAQVEGLARRWVAIEPWQEEGHRALMLALAATGRRAEALMQLATCRRLLDAELGVGLSEETAALGERIRAGDLAHRAGTGGFDAPHTTRESEPAAQIASRQPAPDAQPAPLEPAPLAPLVVRAPGAPVSTVGREAELSWLGAQLADPSCRLLTLVGLGGVGKTRLALAASQAAVTQEQPAYARFPDGVCVVNLAGVDAGAGDQGEAVAAAVAAALRLPPSAAPELRQQLFAALHTRRYLLVLDNMDHLLDAAGLLAELLQRSPGLALLVTSRERLRLSEEWLFEVDGLAYPTLDDDDEIDPRFKRGLPLFDKLRSYGAVQLFLSQVARVQPRLTLDEAALRATLRICRLVEGMPLALELAAAWARSWSCAQIADQIEAGLDGLVSTMRDTSPRHSSMRVVIDQSWACLGDDERRALRRASVFCGGFDSAAAAAVLGQGGRNATSGAVEQILLTLIDKSLLRSDGAGRFSMHELIRKYAAERLAAAGDEGEARRRHSRYYGGWTAAVEAQAGPHQAASLQRLTPELDNLRAAWREAVRAVDVTTLGQACGGVARYLELCGRFREADELFAAAVDALAQVRPARRPGYSGRAGNAALRGAGVQRAAPSGAVAAGRQHALTLQLQAIPASGNGAQPRVAGSSSPPRAPLRAAAVRARLLVRRGLFCERLGAYAEGDTALHGALALLADDEAVERALALNTLARIADRQGDYHLARERCLESVRLARRARDHNIEAAALHNLSSALEGMHAYKAARLTAMTSLNLRRVLGDQRGAAYSLNNLGVITEMLAAYEQARNHYRESLALFESVGDRWGALLPLANLGDVSVTVGDLPTAAYYYLRVLRRAYELWSVPQMLSALYRSAELLERQGEVERAVELLALPLQSRATEQAFRLRCETLLHTLARRVDAVQLEQALARGAGRSLAETVDELLQHGLEPVLAAA